MSLRRVENCSSNKEMVEGRWSTEARGRDVLWVQLDEDGEA